MYVSFGSSSSAFLYSASARANSPSASSATARLLCARALFGSFSTAFSNRKAASRQSPLRATAVPKEIWVCAFSVREYEEHPAATRAAPRTSAAFFKLASSTPGWGGYYRKGVSRRRNFDDVRVAGSGPSCPFLKKT